MSRVDEIRKKHLLMNKSSENQTASTTSENSTVVVKKPGYSSMDYWKNRGNKQVAKVNNQFNGLLEEEEDNRTGNNGNTCNNLIDSDNYSGNNRGTGNNRGNVNVEVPRNSNSSSVDKFKGLLEEPICNSSNNNSSNGNNSQVRDNIQRRQDMDTNISNMNKFDDFLEDATPNNDNQNVRETNTRPRNYNSRNQNYDDNYNNNVNYEERNMDKVEDRVVPRQNTEIVDNSTHTFTEAITDRVKVAYQPSTIQREEQTNSRNVELNRKSIQTIEQHSEVNNSENMRAFEEEKATNNMPAVSKDAHIVNEKSQQAVGAIMGAVSKTRNVRGAIGSEEIESQIISPLSSFSDKPEEHVVVEPRVTLRKDCEYVLAYVPKTVCNVIGEIVEAQTKSEFVLNGETYAIVRKPEMK